MFRLRGACGIFGACGFAAPRHAGPSEEILAQLDLLVSFVGEQAGQLPGGMFVDLEVEGAPGSEHPPPGPRNGAVEAEPVVVGDEQRLRGLVVADIGVHRRAVALGYVGRVRDKEVEPLSEGLLETRGVGRCTERIGAADRDPCAEAAAVRGGDGECRRREVGGKDFGPGTCQGQRGGDAAAPGSDVEHPPGLRLLAEDPVDQLLGLGTRNQHPFAHGEAVSVEVGRSEDVLQGLSRRKALGRRLQPPRGFGCYLPDGVGEELREAHGGTFSHEPPREVPGLARVVERGEACGGAVDGFAEGHASWKFARAMATAASTTTAPRRATHVSCRPRIVSGSTRCVSRL